MSEEIMALLAFPRRLAQGNIELDECRHSGNYAQSDPHCVVCRSRLECEWLYHSDEFSALANRPTEEIVDALRFAAIYVDSRMTVSSHERSGCRCEACTWLNRATTVLERAEGAQ